MPINETRLNEFMGKAYELRKLFSIVNRLVDSMPEGEQDHEVHYVADQGEQLAADLGEALDRFYIDISHAKEVAHG